LTNNFDFLNPDYHAIFAKRLERLNLLRSDPILLQDVRAHYKGNPADFINDWGTTSDPRLVSRGLPAVVPFLLFEKQREMIDYIMRKWKAGEAGLIEKSRDVGASWVTMALACTICLHQTGVVIGFGSRKEEYVDLKGSPKSLFWKGREFIKRLPREFRGTWTEADAPFLRIGFPDTESFISGEAGDGIGRGDRTSLYFIDEAQPLDAKVLTPSGWREMGELCVGDDVIGRNGYAVQITHINDCGEQDVYAITFSDHSEVQCTAHHLWQTCPGVGIKHPEKTIRTCDMLDNFVYRSPGGQKRYRYRIPIAASVEFMPQDELPLHPYIVGALLGDGNLTNNTPRITSADAELIDIMKELMPTGTQIGGYDGRYSYNLSDTDGRKRKGPVGKQRSRMWNAIDAAGLHRVTAPFKSVPTKYLLANKNDRLSLLQGLMDTDGHAQDNGGSAFHTSSKALSEDVAFIVRSLGGMASVSVRSDARGYRDQHYVQVTLPPPLNPFRLSRKATKVFRKHASVKSIVDIKHVGRAPARCITVDAEDGLYVTDDFAVTHNSAHLERPELVDYSLSATTDCRIDMSSVNGMRNPFAEKRHSGRIEVFVFHWRSDPRKDDAWYAKKCLELPPVVVAQELDLDYSASVEGVLIPSEWARACIDSHVRLKITPTGAKVAALDVADAGIDSNALCGTHGILVETLEQWSGKGADIFATTQKAFAICDKKGYPGFTYDGDGLGAGVRGDSRVINEGRSVKLQIKAFRGSASVDYPNNEDIRGLKNIDAFANKKAQGAWALRARVERTYRWVVEGKECDPDEILSISSSLKNYRDLINEMSQPTYKTNGVGKIVIDKAPDGQKSPNLFDALMIRFGSATHRPMIITGGALNRFKNR